MASTRQQNSLSSIPFTTGPDLLSPRGSLIVALVLAVTVFAVYSPSLNFQFILDDHRFTSDPRVQSPGHVWEYFTSFAWAQVPGGPLSFFRPIFVSWLRLNFLLEGLSPWGWHFLSILKHIAAALLLGLLVWKLLRDRIAALLAAALFALHPAQVESVSWVTVPDPLLTIAALACLLLYLKHAEQFSVEPAALAGRLHRKARKQGHAKPASGHSLSWLIASATAFLIALMAKETAVILPVIFFVMALLQPPPQKSAPEKSEHADTSPPAATARLLFAFRELLPFVIAAALYFLLRYHALRGHLASETQHLPPSTVLLSVPATLWFYAKVLFWPVRSRAFADPILTGAFSTREVLLPAAGVLLFVAILVCACVLAWQTASRALSPHDGLNAKRAIIAGSLLLVLPILPTLNLNALNPGDFLHGRYTYLPLAGLGLWLALAYRLGPKNRALLTAIATILLVALSILTIQQEHPWQDDLTLFTFAHEIAPHNLPVDQSLVRAHVREGIRIEEAGQCDQAIPIFNDAIRQYPEDWYAWAALGECLFKQDRLPQAEQALRRASDLAHQPSVTQEWQMVRQKMGLPSIPLE